MHMRTAIQPNPPVHMTTSADSTSEPAANGQSESARPKRTHKIRVYVTAEEHQELRRRAEVRGMKTAHYVRAAGLGQRACSRDYAELAREALAMGHAVMEVMPEQGGERERMLALIRPVLRRIMAHLP